MKKYFLISEVAQLLDVNQSSLRYIEKNNPKIKISKIRGRRYYKASDIEKIAKAIGADYNSQITQQLPDKKPINNPIKIRENNYVVDRKIDLPAVIDENSLVIYDENPPAIQDERELIIYEDHLPMVTELRDLVEYKSSLPVISEHLESSLDEEEAAQLDMFSKMQIKTTLPQVTPLSESLKIKPVINLTSSKKALEEVKTRLSLLLN